MYIWAVSAECSDFNIAVNRIGRGREFECTNVSFKQRESIVRYDKYSGAIVVIQERVVAKIANE